MGTSIAPGVLENDNLRNPLPLPLPFTYVDWNGQGTQMTLLKDTALPLSPTLPS